MEYVQSRERKTWYICNDIMAHSANTHVKLGHQVLASLRVQTCKLASLNSQTCEFVLTNSRVCEYEPANSRVLSGKYDCIVWRLYSQKKKTKTKKQTVFLIMIYLLDLAVSMSNFDIDQISSKLPQRQYFVFDFYCKKICILGILDNAENAK